MANYSYEKCLASSYKVNWRIEDIIGGREFDRNKHWLPAAVSGESRIQGLSTDERRMLTHVEMAAYTHLFGYVEEFIAPKVADLAKEYEIDERIAFDALTNFAAEEVKHMNLFKQLRAMVDETLGFETDLIGGQADTARYVLSKSTGAVLLLTACIEWFTQQHYLEAFRDDSDLDPFTTDIFKAHWQEESQHAQMDHIEAVRAFSNMDRMQRDEAVDDLIELVGAVDGMLQDQVERDMKNFMTYTNRKMDAEMADEMRRGLLSAKRWTFIESGVTHPRFMELIEEVTDEKQRERIGAALTPLLGNELMAETAEDAG
ncbi:MAG: diiron oxygenase [Candidatus Krumholzibacteriota bacterium]